MIIKCRYWAKNVPLEDFRLPKDGRKWRQVCRSRRAVFIEFADRANDDGTFLRKVENMGTVNFSPGFKKLRKHYANGTLSRLLDDLRELGFLTWTREQNCYGRRIYWIHDPKSPEPPVPTNGKHTQNSTNNTFHIQEEQFPHSENNTSHIHKNSSHIRQEQFPLPEVKTVPTSSTIPSFEVPSLMDPSKTYPRRTRVGSSPNSPRNKMLTPQQESYRAVRKLIEAAIPILSKAKSMGQSTCSANVVEDLKSYAAVHNVPYQGRVTRALDVAEQILESLKESDFMSNN
jgi:hypothetical protein